MTTSTKGAVLITRPKEDAETLSHILNEMNIPHIIASMLEVTHEAVSAPVRAQLKQHAMGGIILTSRHAASCLSTLDLSHDIPVYTVGDATAQAAHGQGFSQVISAGGSAEALADYISSNVDAGNGPLFYPHGYDISFNLPEELSAKGYNVISAPVYNAEKIESLSPHFIHSLSAKEIAFATFFSKRSAQSYVDRIQKYGLVDVHASMIALCIKDTVAHSLITLPWQEIRCAQQPSQDAMLQLIRNCY